MQTLDSMTTSSRLSFLDVCQAAQAIRLARRQRLWTRADTLPDDCPSWV